MGADDDLGVLGGLVGGGDAGELLDLAGAGLLVEALGVALLDNGEGRVDKDLDEREARLFVELTRDCAVCTVGRDERGERDTARVREELGDLATAAHRAHVQGVRWEGKRVPA